MTSAGIVGSFGDDRLLQILRELGADAVDRVADFAQARAYVSLVKPVAQAPETDGLSREDKECNFGCIDH